jgi:hypothetical protein
VGSKKKKTAKDARGRLLDDPFIPQITKDGRVLVSRGGRLVVTLAGNDAKKLIAAIEGARDEAAMQQALARATGNYRRGNER